MMGLVVSASIVFVALEIAELRGRPLGIAAFRLIMTGVLSKSATVPMKCGLGRCSRGSVGERYIRRYDQVLIPYPALRENSTVGRSEMLVASR